MALYRCDVSAGGGGRSGATPLLLHASEDIYNYAHAHISTYDTLKKKNTCSAISCDGSAWGRGRSRGDAVVTPRVWGFGTRAFALWESRRYAPYAHSWKHCTAPVCVWRDAFMCVTWRIHVCDMTHSYVWHDAFICEIWLIHISLICRSLFMLRDM